MPLRLLLIIVNVDLTDFNDCMLDLALAKFNLPRRCYIKICNYLYKC